MDTDPVSFKEFDDYLRDLERINVLTLAYRPTLLWLKRALADFPVGRPISVLDVGSGGGGMLPQLRKWACGKNLKLDLTGVDVNPWSTRSAAESTPPEMSIRFETVDRPRSNGSAPDRFYRQFVFHPSPRRRGSGSFYPLDGPLCRARLVHQDLQRHILPYFFIKYATRFLPVNRMARHDGPVSVARAFAADDWRHLLAEAGIPAERACRKEIET